MDGIVENAEGEVGLCEVKVRKLGIAERETSRAKVREASNSTFETCRFTRAAGSWNWCLLITCFVVEAATPNDDDYILVEWWPKGKVSAVRSRVFQRLWGGRDARSMSMKVCALQWSDAKSKLSEKAGAMLKQGHREFFKLSEYLGLHKATDAAAKLALWKRRGFLGNPEVEQEVLRRRGAVMKKGLGASRGKPKGASNAIFISVAKLRLIHEARLRGDL